MKLRLTYQTHYNTSAVLNFIRVVFFVQYKSLQS